MSPSEKKPFVRLVKVGLAGLVVFAFFLVTFIVYFGYILPEETGERAFKIVISVTLGNRNNGTHVWNFSQADRTIGLFMNNSWQTVYLTSVSHQIEGFQVDDDGNPIALMTFPESDMKPGENLSYQVAYNVILKSPSLPAISVKGSGDLGSIPEDLKELYTISSGPWQVNDSRLNGLAHGIMGNETKVLSIVERFVVWIKTNIEYGSLDIPRYPNETVQEGRGDCDDQANLLITFCRAVGIPAYLQIGCIYLPQKYEKDVNWNGSLVNELTRIGWHGWAVVYVPPWGWLPVDLTFARGDLSVEPLNAIATCALVTQPTVQYANITVTDYVIASRRFREFVIAHEFYIYEHDEMSEELTKVKYEKSVPSLYSHLVILIFLISPLDKNKAHS
ncbi:MAG: transglutaminase-like domain-containing protein [Nitrososphaerota archaeon]